MSHSREVAVRTADHTCGHTAGSHADGPCENGIDAAILRVDGDPTEIVLGHGDDTLPCMTPEAAESLALSILELVRQTKAA